MAFRLRGGRPISDELSRLIRKGLRTAFEHLSDDQPGEEAIHEARTSLKKVRAVLRLLQKGLGSDYDSEDARLRSAAHCLAALRDADATTDTLRKLHDHQPTVMTPAVNAAVTRGLRGRKRQARARAGRLLSEARSAIRKTRRFTPKRVRQATRPGVVRDGLVASYRRSRNAMRDLSVQSGDADFHAWRRRVKDHWYHMRLFEGIHRAPRTRARRLKVLETWLGDDHDLALLKMTILDQPDHYGGAKPTAVVLGCIAKNQASLRRHALTLGPRLFADKPRAFRKSMRRWWKH